MEGLSCMAGSWCTYGFNRDGFGGAAPGYERWCMIPAEGGRPGSRS